MSLHGDMIDAYYNSEREKAVEQERKRLERFHNALIEKCDWARAIGRHCGDVLTRKEIEDIYERVAKS